MLAAAGLGAILRVDLKHSSGITRYATFTTFEIGSETDGYPLKVAGYLGDAGNSLSAHNGMKFSTKDRDQDTSESDNCALKYKGGWWFYACHQVSLNGPYPEAGDPLTSAFISWEKMTGEYGGITFSEMKMRYQ